MSQHNVKMDSKDSDLLGKGLESLFGNIDLEGTLEDKNGLTNLSIDLLIPSPYQARRNFNEIKLQELSKSITENGIIQPILVRRSKKKDKHDNYLYEIIAGERRWRASKLANLKKIPVVIREINNQQALVNGLIENIQRHDLNPIEEAQSYSKLIDEFSYTQEQVSKVIGKSRSHIANTIRLLNLPKSAQTLLLEGKISAGHARTLLNCSQADLVLQNIVRNNLNVRQTESLVSELQNSAPDNKKQVAQIKLVPKIEANNDIILLENEITKILSMKAKISLKSDKSGEVRIFFKDVSELDNFMGNLSK